jgi:hypothetical protein
MPKPLTSFAEVMITTYYGKRTLRWIGDQLGCSAPAVLARANDPGSGLNRPDPFAGAADCPRAPPDPAPGGTAFARGTVMATATGDNAIANGGVSLSTTPSEASAAAFVVFGPSGSGFVSAHRGGVLNSPAPVSEVRNNNLISWLG